MYLLMGSNGNITSKAARLLLSQGKKVRVIGRSAQTLKNLQQAGAEPAIGDALDANFLAGAFKDAEAVYAMIPSDNASPDMRAAQNELGRAIASAIVKAGVKRVVNLSSFGAHLPNGTGPIAGLYDQEQRLDRLLGVDILHLRPGYFYENHLHAIGLIQALGAYPGIARGDVPIPTIATSDIAAVVARELAAPSRKAGNGHARILHLHGPRLVTMQEAASVLGAAIGKPALEYVQADPLEMKRGMVQQGFSQSVADLLEEMDNALSDGSIAAGLTSGSVEITPATLEEFAPLFAAAYRA